MNRVNLIGRKLQGYYGYDCVIDSPIIRAKWDWFGESYPDAYEVLKSARHFNVFPYTGFDIVVFPILAWEMSNRLNRYGCVTFDTDIAARDIGRDVDFTTRWEYEFCTGEEWTGYPLGKEGYVRSRGIESGLFLLETIDDLFSIQVASLSDQCTEINLYALEPGEELELATLLSNESHTPSMSEVLSCCCLFIDLVYSLEPGYLHAISIKTKRDISSSIYPILVDLDNRIRKFEEEIQRIEAVRQYLVALEQLVCGPCEAS
jgi:hypothetical protein